MSRINLGDWLAKDSEARLASVILDVASACVEISRLVRGGALSGALGEAGAVNVQGETQKKLDVLSNEICKARLGANAAIAAIASEEEDHAVGFERPDAPFLVAFDPLDGSSNIDVNVTIGTIFSVLPHRGGEAGDDAFLQPGRNQLASGYVSYGPQTCLMLALGGKTLQFTLDPATETFILTHERIVMPGGTPMIGANLSNLARWATPISEAARACLDGGTHNQRWVGSMVADIHRMLHQGGVFLYPGQVDKPNGKLRLLYECNPIALLVANAGGASFFGARRVLEIEPETLHQRIGFASGDPELLTLLRVTA
ncbi:fructose-1,6-bisphosphatase [Arsenicitalea aurantiaca]|uniref:Fructose-1,6-bisphosphatase class 1 n=1 Tax=Arsenicitalea aurantiaca TaxID=1783274 RepID=A0A433X3C1_9HYPH|nr:class 1 fructose-bisphosphatase [Arsenicitalea aurantiaca]RUT28565.1 fructose-1,6-bisphosphatase [Arsenicitalea aurantiaca]